MDSVRCGYVLVWNIFPDISLGNFSFNLVLILPSGGTLFCSRFFSYLVDWSLNQIEDPDLVKWSFHGLGSI